ncbi:MAG: metal-dependent transcriptional regulator [Prolixibacteraceae bacterium]|jgi:DtxR family Mn-dependent transcriptional regulator|nr:metal-dependent transcriptional regulator [Prolixibacteraceae bacterium]
MTVSVDNYIKTIYKQSKLSGADTRLSTIASLLNVSNAAATDMARKLSLKKIVNYTKYKSLSLTEKGEKLALKVIRKHRLWESFLFKTLSLSLHEIHREAEQLEHQTSDFLDEKIEHYLGFPAFDPHGDPIPAINGEIKPDSSQIPLSEAEAECMYEISRLFSSDEDFFEFCTSNHFIIGVNIWVEKQYKSNGMTEVVIDQNKIILNQDISNIIYVKQLN